MDYNTKFHLSLLIMLVYWVFLDWLKSRKREKTLEERAEEYRKEIEQNESNRTG